MLQLDALGGAAVVTVLCPMAGPTSSLQDSRAAYVLSVTASQVLFTASFDYIPSLKSQGVCLCAKFPALFFPANTVVSHAHG